MVPDIQWIDYLYKKIRLERGVANQTKEKEILGNDTNTIFFVTYEWAQ